MWLKNEVYKSSVTQIRATATTRSVCVTSFGFNFSFSSLNLNFVDIYTVIYVPAANRDKYLQKTLPPHRPLFRHFHKCVCVCVCVFAPFVAIVSHTKGSEGQRDSEGETMMTGAAAPPQPVTTQTPHPAQVNIYMGGISMRSPPIHTHTHTHTHTH